MVSHYDLAHLFSIGATKGKGSRMFIDGDTIYSYGYHFPVAVRKEGYYLFNSDGYSSSTSKHKRHVLSNLSGEVIHILSCDSTNKEKQIDLNDREAVIIRDKLSRVRSDGIKRGYLNRIHELNEQNKLLEAMEE